MLTSTAAATANGRMPPTMYMVCQEQCVSRYAFINPPSRGNDAHTKLTRLARDLAGAYSDVNVIKHGVAPPRPSPANKRQATN